MTPLAVVVAVTFIQSLFFGTASKLISFPNHFLRNYFRYLVLYKMYGSGLAVLYLGHSK